jgi:hypothetical protein
LPPSPTICWRALVGLHGPGSVLALATGRDWKGRGSLLIYLLAVPLAFVSAAASMALNLLVALVWLNPDRRIGTRVKDKGSGNGLHESARRARRVADGGVE